MKKHKITLKNLGITLSIFAMCIFLSFLIQNAFKLNTLTPAVFVLGVFLTALMTQGYTYGIVAAVISVVGANLIMTFPALGLNFFAAENIVSAAILIIIALVTCGLTTKIKTQESQKAEGEKERLRANLLRAVSHDLRTPLTTIYGSGSALLENYEDFTDEQKKTMLSGIKEDSEWLIRMVENLLSITRLDGGNVNIIKTETVLDELIDSILVKFAKRYPHQEVRVDIPDEFILIPMDAILIEQVAVNILDNAVQHAEGMTKLSLRVTVVKGKALFEITDDGCGIPDERIKDIFTGYTSPGIIPSDGRRKNAGIGLSVCAAIIKAHGGEIQAKNLKKGGCVFSFTLKMEDDNVK